MMRNAFTLFAVCCTWSAPTVLVAQGPPPAAELIQLRGTPEGTTTRSVRMNGQQRRISVTQKDETITIEDTAAKNITLKRTRVVNGEKKTETFQAPDVETLKKNHPEAAELYGKHAGDAAKDAQLQAQLQLRLNNGGQFGATPFVPRAGQGSRQLMSSSRGKTIEIEDQYGENIKVRITEKGSPEPKVRNVEAKNLAELEQRDTEAAGHYKRLTADN
jgi:hypothetical protein